VAPYDAAASPVAKANGLNKKTEKTCGQGMRNVLKTSLNLVLQLVRRKRAALGIYSVFLLSPLALATGDHDRTIDNNRTFSVYVSLNSG
jgi:hypothetical protein